MECIGIIAGQYNALTCLCRNTFNSGAKKKNWSREPGMTPLSFWLFNILKISLSLAAKYGVKNLSKFALCTRHIRLSKFIFSPKIGFLKMFLGWKKYQCLAKWKRGHEVHQSMGLFKYSSRVKKMYPIVPWRKSPKMFLH